MRNSSIMLSNIMVSGKTNGNRAFAEWSRLIQQRSGIQQHSVHQEAAVAITPAHTFTIIPKLPPSLERLRDLAYNLRWSWNHDTIALFRRLDSDLWEASGHNPVRMLGTIDQKHLEDAAANESFVAHLERVLEDFDGYMQSETTWFRKTHGGAQNPIIAYFSAEFGLTECISIFAGGLGILSGDHLKSASDLGLPLVGVGLLYQQGYFRQYLNAAGWQQEAHEDNDFHSIPATLGARAGRETADDRNQLS